jgi:hypothetical protein
VGCLFIECLFVIAGSWTEKNRISKIACRESQIKMLVVLDFSLGLEHWWLACGPKDKERISGTRILIPRLNDSPIHQLKSHLSLVNTSLIISRSLQMKPSAIPHVHQPMSGYGCHHPDLCPFGVFFW